MLATEITIFKCCADATVVTVCIIKPHAILNAHTLINIKIIIIKITTILFVNVRTTRLQQWSGTRKIKIKYDGSECVKSVITTYYTIHNHPAIHQLTA
jgi:hypothetical protein